ncbi:o-succinylbenzoate synthase [Bacillus sp. V3B]|uniref:o-succinylbenzoate synthase n=1 Tax=Bacillus sp. V3B TaxID=2804915 RepID=UPI002109A293|nr:o-succinylbenzoate synthase [Bacillus sp. V3B]MCQ6276868.1 o-succinylbenzoate synthase [Bacillus sp. V3B]
MKIDRVVLRHLQMEQKSPFTTSFGTFKMKDFILVEAIDTDGVSGWGESVAFHAPWYSEETMKTNWHMLEDFLLPLTFQSPIEHPDQLNERFSTIRKNNMAKSAIEGAVWDLHTKKQGIPLSQALGGKKKQIEVGISIGIQPTVKDLLSIIDKYVTEGYRRMKVKIKPGWDVSVIAAIRGRFPHIQLMADANSAYTLRDTNLLKELDQYNLTMIEQPLASDDIIDHASLQAQLQTPICLDESIHSLEDTRKAISLGSCKVINVKIGRVGGLTEAVRIHDLCKENGIPVWCGGMLEAGVGRAHNIAITTLDHFTMPGDTAASSHYWEKDIIDPEVTVRDGLITVPDKPGIGYEVNRRLVDSYTVSSKTYRKW